jgi:hypothetical protein
VGDEFDPVQWREDQGERLERAIEDIGDPVFGMTMAWDCYRSIGGWSSESLHLRHRSDRSWVEVATSAARHRRDLPAEERHALHSWFLSRIDVVDELVFPLEVVAHRWDAGVEIDGAPYPFSFIGDELTWIAWGDHANRHISIDGRGLHPALVVLETVDPWAYDDPAQKG